MESLERDLTELKALAQADQDGTNVGTVITVICKE